MTIPGKTSVLVLAFGALAWMPVIASESAGETTGNGVAEESGMQAAAPLIYPMTGGKGPSSGQHGDGGGQHGASGESGHRLSGTDDASVKLAALIRAAGNGDVGQVESSLGQGMDPDTLAQRKSGRTVLMVAAANGHVGVVRSLLERGADVSRSDHSGHTALAWAAMRGHSDSAMALIESGAAVDARTRTDVTPLHYAVANGDVDLAEILLDRGADMDVVTLDNKVSPLSLAIETEQRAMIDLLLERGAAVNPQDLPQLEKLGVNPPSSATDNHS